MHQRQANYQLRVCHYLGGDKGGDRGSRQTVTKCDKGGSKIGGRPVTYFLNGPYDNQTDLRDDLDESLLLKRFHIKDSTKIHEKARDSLSTTTREEVA